MGTNSSNATVDGLSIVSSWISLIVLIIPAIVVNIISLVNLTSDVKLAKSVRISLSNILIGCLLVALFGIIKYISGLVTGYNDLSSSEKLCHFIIWIYFIGQASRSSFMALLAVVVYILIKRGEPTKTRKGRIYLSVSVGALWLFVVLITSLFCHLKSLEFIFLREYCVFRLYI